MPNRLYYGDNLQVLREHIADESIDLIYLDPPFNSKQDYNVLFKSPTGQRSEAQIEAFKDSWSWESEETQREYNDLLHCPNVRVVEVVEAFHRFLDGSDMMAYLVMMANRLVELHRVLKPTGSLYLHCDPTASHYVKVTLDAVFGPEHFRNEVVWKRTSAHNRLKRYGPVHDTLLFYTKGATWTWNEQRVPYDEEYVEAFYHHADAATGRRYMLADITSARPGGRYLWNGQAPPGKRYWGYAEETLRDLEAQGRLVYSRTGLPRLKKYLDEQPGVSLQSVWTDVPPISSQAAERLGYPTQKPLALLERILNASSNHGDVVLDPFCGCGTAVHAAQKLGRRWLGIDITHLAITLIETRLRNAFGAEAQFEVVGTPKDIGGATDLAARDKYQFQWWACSLVGAQPYQGHKKGADGGIDGKIFFHDGEENAKQIIVSVKGGEHVSVTMVRELIATVEREKASLGFFVTLTPPTRPMLQEAASAGFYESPFHGAYPKIQILTVGGLLDGTERPEYTDMSKGGMTFKRAQREQPRAGRQRTLGIGNEPVEEE